MSEGGPKVVVVGGGVIGVSCAYYLARGGASVVLLERDAIAAGASSGNAGTIAVGHPPLNRPGRIRQAVRQMLDPTSPLYVPPRLDPALWRWLLGFARYCTDEHVEHSMKVMAPLGRLTRSSFDEILAIVGLASMIRGDTVQILKEKLGAFMNQQENKAEAVLQAA